MADLGDDVHLDEPAVNSTPANPYRMKTLDTFHPAQDTRETVDPTLGCSAHYFDVKRNLVAYSWYDQGTRILDISNPAKPIQVAYYRPDGGVSRGRLPARHLSGRNEKRVPGFR